MARISLIICDLCGDKINEDEAGQYEVSLICNSNGSIEPGEMCGSCYKALLLRLRSETKPVLRAAEKSLEKRTDPVATPASSTTSAAPEASEPALGPSEAEKAERKPTKELLDDELTKVPSKFNRRKAEAKVTEMKGGTCPHYFKSVDDKGRIICSAAPPGASIPADAQGHRVSTGGCGKVLTKAEY